MFDAAGHQRRIRSLPVAPALWALRVLERAKLSPLYPWIYETVTEDSFVSIDKARDQLGWTPRYSNKAALVRNYDWYCTNVDRLGAAGRHPPRAVEAGRARPREARVPAPRVRRPCPHPDRASNGQPPPHWPIAARCIAAEHRLVSAQFPRSSP